MLQAIKKAREEDAKKAEQEVNPDELIFPKRSGKDGVMAQASKVFADTVKELGLNRGVTDRKQKVTFHTLRHTYGYAPLRKHSRPLFDAAEPWPCHGHHDGAICEDERKPIERGRNGIGKGICDERGKAGRAGAKRAGRERREIDA